MKKLSKRRAKSRKVARPKPSRGPTPPKAEAYRINPAWLAALLQRGQCPACSGGECTGMPGCVARRG